MRDPNPATGKKLGLVLNRDYNGGGGTIILIKELFLVVQYLGELKVNLWEYKGMILPQQG